MPLVCCLLSSSKEHTRCATSFTTGHRSKGAANLFGSRSKTRARTMLTWHARPKGMAAMMRFMESSAIERPPFAPPFLKAGKLVIAQTANILFYLGPRLDLAPKSEPSRLWAHQLQLTIADWVAEAHDTHHPISGSLYYEDQKAEAKRRAADFTAERMPKFFDYFEANTAAQLERKRISSRQAVFLCRSLAFSNDRRAALCFSANDEETRNKISALGRATRSRRRAARASPRISHSPRRIPFNQEGIFRHYPELDG